MRMATLVPSVPVAVAPTETAQQREPAQGSREKRERGQWRGKEGSEGETASVCAKSSQPWALWANTLSGPADDPAVLSSPAAGLHPGYTWAERGRGWARGNLMPPVYVATIWLILYSEAENAQQIFIWYHLNSPKNQNIWILVLSSLI